MPESYFALLQGLQEILAPLSSEGPHQRGCKGILALLPLVADWTFAEAYRFCLRCRKASSSAHSLRKTSAFNV